MNLKYLSAWSLASVLKVKREASLLEYLAGTYTHPHKGKAHIRSSLSLYAL